MCVYKTVYVYICVSVYIRVCKYSYFNYFLGCIRLEVLFCSGTAKKMYLSYTPSSEICVTQLKQIIHASLVPSFLFKVTNIDATVPEDGNSVECCSRLSLTVWCNKLAELF